MSLFELKTKIRRFLNKSFKTHKPTSFPFISGNSFRAMAQHVLDEYFDFNPKQVFKNDIVFVRGNFLNEFFEKIYSKIENPFILISHNDDTNVTEKYKDKVGKNIIHWFALNCLVNNDRITPIPLGIDNLCKSYNNRDLLKYADDPKINKIVWGFSKNSHEERILLDKILKNSPICDEIIGLNKRDYLKKIKNYKFIISPQGRGLDCHRTWEALYLGIIPIIKKNPWSEYMEKTGIPLLIINDWKEINSFSEKELEKIYLEKKPGLNSEIIFQDYWNKKIYEKILK